MSKISDLSDGGVIQGGDTLIAVRSGGNVKVTYGGSTTANIDGGTIDGTVIGGTTAAAGSFTTVTADGLTVNSGATDEVARFEGTGSPYISWYDSGTRQAYIGSFGNSFSIVGDTPDTTVSIATGGTNRVTVASTGIDVQGSAILNNSYRFQVGGSSTGDSYVGDLRNTAGVLTLRTEGARNMAFDTNGSERMRIDSSGNVGIGTSFPSGALHVAGKSTGRNTIVSNVTLDGGSAVSNPFDGFGFGINFTGKDYGNAVRDYAYIYSVMEDQSSSSGGGDAGFKAGLRFYTNGGGASGATPTERMRIDSSGNVGIGTDSPRNDANFKTLQIGDSSTAASQLVLDDNDSSGPWRIISNLSLIINDDTDERMRIDSSGNLLVGTTDTTVYNNSANSTADNGFQVNPAGWMAISAYQQTPAFINRTGNDGSLISFTRSGSSVGSIGTSSTDGFYIHSTFGNDSGLVFGSERIVPCTSTGDFDDAAVDLGYLSGRFKDLYLSGGVYLGGTGDANKLDDYEEGTWTPTIIGTTSGSATVTVTSANYTKIGDVVHVYANISADLSSHNVVGVVEIGGLPFNAPTIDNGSGNAGYNAVVGGSVFFRSIGTRLRLTKGTSTNWLNTDLLTGASALLMFQATYRSA